MVRRRVVRARRRSVLTRGRALALVAFVTCATRCSAPPPHDAPPHAARVASPQPGAPVYAGRPATHFALVAHPLGFDVDGNARVAVVVRFIDGGGATTRILANSDVDWRSRASDVQWQTRMRYGQPSAIVSRRDAGPLVLVAHVDRPELGTRTIVVDPSRWRGARAVAAAAGPHAAQIGWYPRARTDVRVERVDATGRRMTLATLAAPSSSYRDVTVQPGRRYRYVLLRPGATPVTLPSIVTPPEAPPTSTAGVRGKAMWLAYSTNPIDADYYAKLDPPAIVERAVEAGLHAVQLRVAYGGYDEIVPAAKPVVDAIVDGLARRGVGTIAWTVPRTTAAEDLDRTVRAASYRTARGTRFVGVAIDLERGPEFMGAEPETLAAYVRRVREALGPKYLVVATVEDPYVERLDGAAYPYAAIGRDASVVQTMAYWRAMLGHASTSQRVAAVFRASFARLRALGVDAPIAFGGDTSQPLRGAATPGELRASIATAKALGALGVCYFDWNGTSASQWRALHDLPW